MPKPNMPANNNGRGDAKKYNEKRVLGGAALEVHWSDVDATELLHFVDKATRAGAGVILSITRDGGALSLTVIDGNDRYREYPHTSDEVLVAMHEILEEITG